MSEDSFNVRQPSIAEARVRQFMDLSNEYMVLVPHRTVTPAYFTADNEDALSSYREGLLAQMLMRKFVTKGESVHIPRVCEHLVQDYGGQLPKEFQRQLNTYKQNLSASLKRITDRGVAYAFDGADTIPDRIVLDNYLNGRLLHSDFEKWQRSDTNTFRVMLGSWLGVRADFRAQLEDSRHNLSFAVTEYQLFTPPTDGSWS